VAFGYGADFELTLNPDTQIQVLEDDARIEAAHFDFVKIDTLPAVEPGSNVDVLGVITAVEPLGFTVSKKSGQEIKKRNITVRDDTGKQVTVDVWWYNYSAP
jgi:replication factor A1